MIGIVVASIVLYFVIYRLVEDKALANFKSILLLVLLPCLSLIALRLLLKSMDFTPTVSLILLLSAFALAIIYIFKLSKSKFKLSNIQAASVSVVYFFSIWVSEILHGVIMAVLFT
ncbi:MAG: hypothetical protein GY823_02625 [Flavobacteriaceae bacterium]|nr:hypothetical protein [Flavobacteriaceae bacterium]